MSQHFDAASGYCHLADIKTQVDALTRTMLCRTVTDNNDDEQPKGFGHLSPSVPDVCAARERSKTRYPVYKKVDMAKCWHNATGVDA